MKQRTLVSIAALLLTLVSAAQAGAQSLRTFVAVTGNDANDCTFSTPCRTFAGAVPNTAAGGEITALDSGSYGVVTVSKALTLQAAPGAHVALGESSVTSAVKVNAGALSLVVLRNLYIGGTGQSVMGIDFHSPGAVLHLEGCVVTGFAAYGIWARGICSGSGACLQLFIKDTILRQNNHGIVLENASAVIDRSWIENNMTGLWSYFSGGAVIRDSVVAGNSDFGLFASTSIRVEDCLVTRNGTGIQSNGLSEDNTAVFVSNTMIVGNVTGLKTNHFGSDGEIISYGNNRLAANTTNGAFTSTLPQQ